MYIYVVLHTYSDSIRVSIFGPTGRCYSGSRLEREPAPKSDLLPSGDKWVAEDVHICHDADLWSPPPSICVAAIVAPAWKESQRLIFSASRSGIYR